jgi:hypothetical protein
MRIPHKLLLCTALILLLGAAGALALPAGEELLIVEATLIEGLADYHGEIVETHRELFTRENGTLSIDRDGLASLDGLEAIVLVDRRRDTQGGDTLTRKHWQEIHAVSGGSFELAMLPDEPFLYQIANVNGKTGLFGQGNLLRSEGGEGEPFQVWRIDSMRFVDRTEIALR